MLKDSRWILRGERVAILRDEAEDTYGSGIIVRPDTHKYPPLSGHIIAIGSKVPEDEGFRILQEVTFNSFNVHRRDQIEVDGYDEPLKLDVLHYTDIYWERAE